MVIEQQLKKGKAMSEMQVKMRKLAKEQFLKEINYLDKDGNCGARGKKVHLIELVFDNGESIKVTPQEMQWAMKIEFKLLAADIEKDGEDE